jgi:hypothetical protein
MAIITENKKLHVNIDIYIFKYLTTMRESGPSCTVCREDRNCWLWYWRIGVLA